MLKTARTRHVALMVTRRCNMSCGHCSVESGPQVRAEPEEAELVGIVQKAAAADVASILITGGEPMLREQIVLRLLRECQHLGLMSAMTTNGYWGRSLEDARRRLLALRRAGLGRLAVSYDRYHAEFQGHGPALNIARAADEIGFPITINITRTADEPDLVRIVSPFERTHGTSVRLYDVQPVGRARLLPAESLRGEVEGFCNAAESPAITDDGRVMACNGPSYFAGSDSPLHVGSLGETPLSTLLLRHREDPILETIRTFGPARLRDELKQLPGFAAFPFRSRYAGICDLCCHITSHPGAVVALQKHLSQPRYVAERLAMRKVIGEARAAGPLRFSHTNGPGAGRIFLQAARADQGARFAPEVRHVLGRADLDWNRLCTYLGVCGLARPLLSTLADAELARWAPRFFIERMNARAINDGIKELVQREALRRLRIALGEIGGRGVLLKGSAFLLLGPAGAHLPRATGDIDVYVEPDQAPVLRDRLLALGFDGSPGEPRTAPHHLAPVSLHGVPVEIHTRLMPWFWGLPERDLLAGTHPLPDGGPLSTLSPEGLLLHACVHTTAHLFSFGLKTAWDLQWVPWRFPALDWDRLASLADAARLPRAFWVPARVLCQELSLEVPGSFLRRAPSDAQQQRLERIARARLFSAHEGPFDLNPFSKNGVFFLLHDSWLGGAAYLLSLATGAAAEARRTAWQKGAGGKREVLAAQLRGALSDWRKYRALPR